ncbi:oligosaccharide MFS transporter [Pseudoalteromonas sp. Isolate3]|uniref:oligosaccharide MFS transporter n=1 Tax=Pseudoalteromonas sp. Isolate3 TaxID=2908526 RepID=UPI001EFCA491|nr:oligosaccharide MFS transporter [Pseudoalteromonas sp. Isolate3]MCG9710587.1 oligosaccharide MFS transporter [Pseudoalteromonas sp. Isolate3]
MGRNYRLLSAIFFVYFMAWSFSFSLYPIWLSQEIGLNGELVGIVFSVNALTALLIMPWYGYIQDKLGLKKGLLYFIAIAMVLLGPFVNLIYEPFLKSHFYLAVFLGGTVFSLVFLAGVGALESYIDKQSRVVHFEFGKARMWGSLGWAVASYFAGLSFNITPSLNYWLTSIAALCFLVLLKYVKVMPDEVELRRSLSLLEKKRILSFFKIPGLWRLSLFVVGVSCIYAVFDQQFAIYFTTFFEDRSVAREYYGYLMSAQVVLEALFMFLGGKWVNRLGVKRALLCSGVLMAIRIFLSGVVTDSYSISLLKLLHAVELPLMIIAIFKYINMHFEARYSAMIYMIGFQFTTQFMASILAIGVGMLYDQIGYVQTYRYLGIVVTIFIIISYFTLSNDNPKRNCD